MKFTKVLKNIIVENRVQILLKNLTEPVIGKDGKKQPPKLTIEEFFNIVQADPTTRMNNVDPMTATKEEIGKIKAGEYVNWIIRQFLKVGSDLNPKDNYYKDDLKIVKDRFIEDLYEITESLTKFKRFKNRLEEKNIDKYDKDSLYDAVKDFSLALASTTKAERKTMDIKPGSRLLYDGSKWRVIEIYDQGEEGKEAACYYGGDNVETRWCTSARGLNWFDKYIKNGPLYVIFDPNDPVTAEKTGLPVERYQFSFADNQYMDKDDRSQDLKSLLNGKMSELKDVFKPLMLQNTFNSKKVEIEDFNRGALGKYREIYGDEGLNDIMDMIPSSVEGIIITNKDKGLNINLNLSGIGRFKNLKIAFFDNCISDVPESMCELKELNFIAVPNNSNLKTLPSCLADLPKLQFMNLRGSDNLNIPDEFSEKGMVIGNGMIDFGLKKRKK